MLNIRASFLYLLLFISACRATAPDSSAVSAEVFPVTKEQEQTLFLKMLAVELKADVPVVKDQQHLARGVLECRRTDSGKSCHLKTLTASDTLSADQEIAGDFSDSLWDWTLTVRPELATEVVFSTDVRCTLIGKKSPPFEVEDVTCRIYNPGVPKEAHFEGALAGEIFRLLGGPSGSLICRVAEGSGRRFCLLRRQDKGLMNDHIAELGTDSSKTAFDSLLTSKLKSASADGHQGKQTVMEEVTEIPARISCWNSGKTSNHRVMCRSRLP